LKINDLQRGCFKIHAKLAGILFCFLCLTSPFFALPLQMKEILVEIVNQYGVERIRVVDQKTRETISSLTGRKTILQSDIKALKELGFSVRLKSVQSVEL
jgi:hypothetical protein